MSMTKRTGKVWVRISRDTVRDGDEIRWFTEGDTIPARGTVCGNSVTTHPSATSGIYLKTIPLSDVFLPGRETEAVRDVTVIAVIDDGIPFQDVTITPRIPIP